MSKQIRLENKRTNRFYFDREYDEWVPKDMRIGLLSEWYSYDFFKPCHGIAFGSLRKTPLTIREKIVAAAVIEGMRVDMEQFLRKRRNEVGDMA